MWNVDFSLKNNSGKEMAGTKPRKEKQVKAGKRTVDAEDTMVELGGECVTIQQILTGKGCAIPS